MKSVIHYPAPNIVPGLNLTSKRFADMFAWITAHTSDTAAVVRKPYQFGLTIAYDNRASLVLEKKGAQLVLSRCSAITPAGSIIGHFEGMHAPVLFDLKESEMRPHETYAVYLEVQHSGRCAYGPESEDMPLRPLYSRPACLLQVQPLDQQMAFQTDALCIGLLKMELGLWQLAPYIPPCAQVGADSVLTGYYQDFQEALNMLNEYFPKIILNTDAYHEKSMVELREFAMHAGSFVSAERFRYMHIGQGGTPFEIFAFWASLAQQISFLLQCLKDRAGFYNLLNENTRQRNGVFFTAQTWDAAIQHLARLKYDHNNLSGAVDTVNEFLETVMPVLVALSYGVEELKSRTGWQEQKRKASQTW